MVWNVNSRHHFTLCVVAMIVALSLCLETQGQNVTLSHLFPDENPFDCMHEYIELSGISRSSSNHIHAALRKNRLDQEIFNGVSGYADIGHHLAEVGVASAADRFHLYLCLRKDSSTHLKCHTQPACNKGSCNLFGKTFQCKCDAGYGGARCDRENSSLGELEKRLALVEKQLQRSSTSFVRWGRQDCPDSASLVYTGYSAGSHYSHTGSGSNLLCLHSRPAYDSHEDYRWGSPVNGVSYSLLGREKPFSSNALEGKVAPCAVCLVQERTTSIMVPGRQDCPVGWNRDYFGYLMAPQYRSDQKGEYTCIDHDPRGIEPVGASGHRLTVASVGRGYGLGDPYVDGRELTCSVCSK